MSNTKLQRIKTMLSELLQLEMASATTDKGIIYWNEDELEVGSVIYVQDDNDIKVIAEDGDYEFDGKVIKVVEGKVSEISDKIVPVEIVPAEPEAEPEVEDDPTTEEDETPEMEEEPNEVAELKEKVEALTAEIEALKAAIAELGGKPAAMNAVEQFEQLKKKEKSVKGVARYADAIADIRKN